MLHESKKLNLNSAESIDNPLPKVRYEDIPQERRRDWEKKDLADLTEDEFEEWLACELEDNKVRYIGDIKSPESFREVPATEEDQKTLATYHRGMYRHIRKFTAWRKSDLDPAIEELADMAMHDPQYDWHFLYHLEQQKLICMEKYLSHSLVANSNGNYVGKQWLVLCITLLDYILGKKMITQDQIHQMNISNMKGLVDDWTLQKFEESMNSKDKDSISFYGKEIYTRKMERLYHLTRLYKTRHWWE